MEQLKYLEKKLYIKYLPDLKISGQKYKNSHVLMASLLAFTFLNALGYLSSLSLLVFGIVLPVCCLIKGADLGGYFPLLSILLWLRTWYYDFTSLDVRYF